MRSFGLVVASDGDTFGRPTELAVREFQQRRGLRIDGVCGQDTWSALVEAGYRLGDRLLYLRRPDAMQRGDDVVELQHQLGTLGFHVNRVDGIFGPETQDAVEAFQRNAGLVVDGTVGFATISALRRLRSRGPAGDPAALRETVRLHGVAAALHTQHIAVGEAGGLGALARETQRVLTGRGASVTVLAHPEPAELAAQANTARASVYVGLGLSVAGTGCGTAFWGGLKGATSPAGQRLATLVLEELSISGAGTDGPARPMNTPVLRETKMPAVFVELGPARFVVERSADVALAIGRGISRWAADPCVS